MRRRVGRAADEITPGRKLNAVLPTRVCLASRLAVIAFERFDAAQSLLKRFVLNVKLDTSGEKYFAPIVTLSYAA